MTNQTPNLDRVRTLLAQGYKVTDVGSTDDELALVLGRDRVEHTIMLNREETRRMVDEDVLSQRRQPLLA